MKSPNLRAVALAAFLGLSALAPVVAPSTAFAQSEYSYRQVQQAHAALNPNDTVVGGSSPTPIDTSAYGAAFDQMKSNMNSVATGPVGLGAFGLLVIGIIFGVAWRLIKKGGSAVGR